MENIRETVNSNSNSKFNKLNNSNSNTVNSNSYLNKEEHTVSIKHVFSNITDLVKPEDSYMPFYLSRYKQLGYKRFMELANKSRAGKTPDRLFFWMLKNNELVK